MAMPKKYRAHFSAVVELERDMRWTPRAMMKYRSLGRKIRRLHAQKRLGKKIDELELARCTQQRKKLEPEIQEHLFRIYKRLSKEFQSGITTQINQPTQELAHAPAAN